jgi:transposase, IS30 family
MEGKQKYTLDPPMTYSQLTLQQRIEFQIHKHLGVRIVDIAKMLGVHFSSLYRERNRNSTPAAKYEAVAANEQAKKRRALPRAPTVCTPENTTLVEALLENENNGLDSPDTIAGRSKIRELGIKVCGSSIYKMIEKDRRAGGKIYRLLPRGGRSYRKSRTGARRKGKLAVRPEQELACRPEGINQRNEPGHVEIDLMFSGETIFLTCQDRFTKNIWVRAVPSKESKSVAAEICLIYQEEYLRSATFDRGLEWAQVDQMLSSTLRRKCNLYFCRAYCSWEKGGIENANRQLRGYFPKRQNLPWDAKGAILGTCKLSVDYRPKGTIISKS